MYSPRNALFKSNLTEVKLLECVLKADEYSVKVVKEAAKTMPKLFFKKASAMDFTMDLEGNRRLVKDWSAYQALFGTGNINLLNAIESELNDYLSTLVNGREFAFHQIIEKFPHGFEFSQSTYDFSALIEAISKDDDLRKGYSGLSTDCHKPAQHTLNLIMDFRKAFKPEVVEIGHHFNVNELINAYKIHTQFLGTWNGWNLKQHDFFVLM